MSYTPETLAKEFFECIKHTNAQRTIDNYKRYIQDWLKTVTGVPLEELRPYHLLRWGKTWHQIQAVQRLFSWAATDAEIIGKNPFRKVRKPAPGRRKRTLTRRQYLTLCRSTDRAFRRFLLAMGQTLARPQEIRALQWEFLHVDGDEGSYVKNLREGKALFVLEEYKARKRRSDPDKPRVLLISKRLGRMLARICLKSRTSSGLIFRNRNGKPWTANAVRIRMRRLRKKCGLNADYRGEEIVCYTLRHTGATVAAAKGVRDKLLAELMGHTSTKTTARYQHLDTEHLREAFDKFTSRKQPEVK